jgi:hypothetical protein
MINKYEGKVMWAQMDANQHLRHSAYADFAAQARMEILESMGFDLGTMAKHQIGPIFYVNNLNVDYINNTVTGTVEAYYYKFINSVNNIEEWLPSNPQMDLRYTIALHLKGNNDLGIQNIEEPFNVSVFPNPSNSEVFIRNVPLSIGKYNIHIYDASGRIIESKVINEHSDKIDVSNLGNGLYIFHLEVDNFNAFPKFIKQ